MSPKKHDRRVAVFVRRKCSQQLSAGQGLTAWLWGRAGKEPGKARNRWMKPTLHRACGVSAQRVAAGALPPVGDFFPVLQSTRSEGRGRRWLLSHRAGFGAQTFSEAHDSHCFGRDPE